ncbi:4-hydroxyproline epimerase [Candidatus Sumerlaeota bacterium]|nr:4-hydroxyproline epimerase [Candidatus Sumerlaeota bacterium]
MHIIDSHTGGEPTRVVISGWPELGRCSLAERRDLLRREHDDYRSATVQEPRGADQIVGALLCEPNDPSCSAGVIFFNNIDYLGMCGHGTIGVVVTLNWLGRITAGVHRIETPVGIVETELHATGEVTVRNVPSYRYKTGVEVQVEGFGPLKGDVAWGGNWFFLVNEHGQEVTMKNIDALTGFSWRIRQALEAQGVTGKDGALIDHIELYGPPSSDAADSKNFVLCPGKAYDRSPCGTGTSAKLACLYDAGKLKEGEIWRQESIIGSVFEGKVEVRDGQIIPWIKGSAFINSEATLILDSNDPFCMGIRSE